MTKFVTIVLACISIAQGQYIVTTFAGGGILNGVSATTVGIGWPNGVTKDASGNVYFTSETLNRVFKVDPQGKLSVVAGNGGEGYSDDGPALAVALEGVSAITLDATGTIYIAEAGRIRKIANGAITTLAIQGVFLANSIAIDPSGNLYISDSQANRVLKVVNGVATTFAGTGFTGFAGDRGPAVIADLNRPAGLAFDSSGNLFIADLSNNRVRKVTNGIITTVAGNGVDDAAGDGGPATSAAVGETERLSVDSAGDLYIAARSRVRKVTNGVISLIAGTGGSLYSGDGGPAIQARVNARDVFADSAGDVYVADWMNSRIRRISSGAISTFAGDGSGGYFGEDVAATLATLAQPNAVAVDKAGNVFILDSGNNRIRKVMNGQINTIIADVQPCHIFFCPGGVAVDDAGQLFFIDGNVIRKYANGTITTVAGNGSDTYSGDGGPAIGAGIRPNALALDGDGNIYVAEGFNRRVRKIMGGVITTVAGNGGAGSTGDGGPATSASVSFPQSIAVDPSGNIYIADLETNSIRKVANGIITTVAGGPMNNSLGDGGPVGLARVHPVGLALDQKGSLFLTDNVLVREVSNGIINTIAGFGVRPGYSGDGGLGSSALFWSPAGITVDVNGSIYVADSVNNNVRKLTPITNGALTLSRNKLNFGVTYPMTTMTTQSVGLTFSVPGVVWTATSSQPNITVSPSSGIGDAMLKISVTPGQSGAVVISATVANAPQSIQVSVAEATHNTPYGSFDTPLNNTTGIAGAIAVTGWALDDIEVDHVGVWREPVANEPVSSNGPVFIGNGTWVAGARPDVESAYPNAPLNYRAGWGYLLLTNFLPGNGNGTYKLHAIAVNKTGGQIDLGTKLILVDNAHASKPFGTIDTPDQGALVSGTAYLNFGWALTPMPACIPTDGSTIQVFVDGVMLGHPVYNQGRSDIAAVFPGFCNTAGAVGYFYIDTTKLSNGIHTMSWVVYDNQNRGDGIGSRYITVQNSASGSAAVDETFEAVEGPSLRGAGRLSRDRRAGYLIDVEELGRIELHARVKAGYSEVNGERRALPVGSAVRGGVFYWQLGPGFLGEYQLVLVRVSGERDTVRVRVGPAGSTEHLREQQ
jgi:sugar lactone lactonase YvrE